MSDSFDENPAEQGLESHSQEEDNHEGQEDFADNDSHDGEQGDDSAEGDSSPKSSRSKTAVARPKATVAPKTGVSFTWSDVESIISFVNAFNSGTEKERTTLKAVFGAPAKADALAVAQVLHSGANMSVYKDASGFIETIIKGKFDIMATFALISELTKRDDEYVRDFFRVVNAFIDTEVRYRKNAALPTLLEPLVVQSQSSLTEADKKTLKWIDGLLAVWPK